MDPGTLSLAPTLSPLRCKDIPPLPHGRRRSGSPGNQRSSGNPGCTNAACKFSKRGSSPAPLHLAPNNIRHRSSHPDVFPGFPVPLPHPEQIHFPPRMGRKALECVCGEDLRPLMLRTLAGTLLCQMMVASGCPGEAFPSLQNRS